MLAGALAILIWGPRPDPPVPADRANDVVLQYWEKWTGNESESMQKIVDDFNNTEGKQKHIYVQYLSMSNISQKMLTATAAGVPPDVAGLWQDYLAQLAALGALEPLDDLAAQHDPPITASIYKPVYWESCHYDGKLYSLVSTPATVALFYNKDIFAEEAGPLRAAGLDPDRAPRTLQELDAYAKVLDKWEIDSDGNKHLIRAGYVPMEPGWYINQMSIWFGQDIWDDKARKFTVNSPAVLNACEWVQSYANRLGIDAMNRFAGSNKDFNTPQNPFMSGRVAMEMQGPWMANFIKHVMPSLDGHYGVSPFPSAVGMQNVTFCPFDTLMIPAGGKHKKEAFDFIAFVQRQDEMEKLCSLHCKNSPLAQESPGFIKNHPNPYIQVFEDLASSPNAHGPIQCPIAPAAGTEIQAMYQSMVDLSGTPKTAVADTQKLLDAKLADYRRKNPEAN
jgi:ABC-type glycerol-3-phosphate transport system substrate-binding protein